MMNVLLWPFFAAFFAIMIVVGVLFFIFWVWMIVDCAQRNFKNDVEKIIWIIVIVLGSWIGALVYYFVVKSANPEGLSREKSYSSSSSKRKRK